MIALDFVSENTYVTAHIYEAVALTCRCVGLFCPAINCLCRFTKALPKTPRPLLLWIVLVLNLQLMLVVVDWQGTELKHTVC
jgi:hypothetical protein